MSLDAIQRARQNLPITAAELGKLPAWLRNRKERPAPSTLAIANQRRPICENCERFQGKAGELSVHCGCRGGRPCANLVRLDQTCPEGKWGQPAWIYDVYGYPACRDGHNPRLSIDRTSGSAPLPPLRTASLAGYCGRVVVISLKHRAERLQAFLERLPKDWPFRRPVCFDAIHGNKLPRPIGWKDGGGAWGCMLSHRAVLQQAILDDVDRVLVLEDDAVFADGFTERIAAFLGNVPAGWDQLMIGGQLFGHSQSIDERPGVRRVSHVERTHAYALQGDGLRSLYQFWMSVGGHCDHRMGEWQDLGKKVYAPSPFLVYQAAGWSDIQGITHPLRTWNPSPLSEASR